MTTITVYGKPACMQCRMTENTLTKAGVEYIKRDVTADLDALLVVQKLGYLQVPVVVVKRANREDHHWSGFRPDLLAGYTIKEPRA